MDEHLDRFAHPTYLIRKQFFKIFGESFHLYDPRGEVALYSKLKAFRLKEDIRLYDGPERTHELLTIRSRQVLDWGATYDVVDPRAGGEKIGALRRRALRSMFRDEWMILDEHDREVGRIIEDSTFKALVRRFVDMASLLMPQSYHVEMNGRTVARFHQKFNPLIQKIELDFTADTEGALDRRVGIAAGILMAAIEGREG